jgi:hypothetical protein
MLCDVQVLYKLNRQRHLQRQLPKQQKHTLRLMLAVTAAPQEGAGAADAEHFCRVTDNGLGGNKSVIGVSMQGALTVLGALQQALQSGAA